MSKLRIKLITLGHLPIDFDKEQIKKHKSDFFELVDNIDNISLSADSDGTHWEFSDGLLMNQIPSKFECDFLIVLTNVPLESNYYTRRIEENKVIFTFHETKDFLHLNNIPLENAVYRLLYGYSLIFKRSDNRIPEMSEVTDFAHDETRGCLFDMNGIKSEIIHSCSNPIICDDCSERLRREKVSNDFIEGIKKEIKQIKKKPFYQITDFIKLHPILSIIISSLAAIVLGAIGSIIGTIIYECLK